MFPMPKSTASRRISARVTPINTDLNIAFDLSREVHRTALMHSPRVLIDAANTLQSGGADDRRKARELHVIASMAPADRQWLQDNAAPVSVDWETEFDRCAKLAHIRQQPRFNGPIVLLLIGAALALAFTIHLATKAAANLQADLARAQIEATK